MERMEWKRERKKKKINKNEMGVDGIKLGHSG